MRRSLVAASTGIVSVALTLLAGCASSEKPVPSPPPPTGPAAEVPAPAASPGTAAAAPPGEVVRGPAVPGVPALTGDPNDVTRQTQAQPSTGQPPTTLLTQDIVVGNGARLTPDDTVVQVRYTGTLYTDGKVFDSSWARGSAPVSFPLANVVPGFAQGVAGMKQGGRRVIVIPPNLGYGPSADGPIPGNSTLVFVVDLIGVT